MNLLFQPGISLILLVIVITVGILLYRYEKKFPESYSQAFKFARRCSLVFIIIGIIICIVGFVISSKDKAPIGMGLSLLAIPVATIILGVISYTLGLALYTLVDLLRKVLFTDKAQFKRLDLRRVFLIVPVVLVIFFILFQKHSQSVRAMIKTAKSPTELEIIYDSLFAKIDWRINRALSTNKSLSPQLIQKLSLDDDEIVRANVAWNPTSSEEVLLKLSKDSSERVRWQLARNKNISPDILEKLSKDRSESVRYSISRNNLTPISILYRLKDDPSPNVRYGVATNTSTPNEIMEFLSDDDSLAFPSFQYAHAHPLYPFVKRKPKSKGCYKYTVKSGIAGNENIPVELIYKLSKDKDCSVRREIANNELTSVDILESLLTDTEEAVKYSARTAFRRKAE